MREWRLWLFPLKRHARRPRRKLVKPKKTRAEKPSTPRRDGWKRNASRPRGWPPKKRNGKSVKNKKCSSAKPPRRPRRNEEP